jgi:hypothetical protein
MVKRQINAIAEVGFANKGSDLIKAAQISGKTLNGSGMNSLSGILYQLNSLATIANELFQSVLDSSKETYTRINNISERVANVNGKLDSIGDYIEKNSGQFYANGSYKLTEQNQKVFRQKTEHCVDANNMPPALKWQYDNNTEALPNFDVLNEYHEKKDCLKDFSDPGFFFESWASFELAKLEKRKIDKAKKPKKEKVATIEKQDPKYDKYGFAKDDKKQTGQQTLEDREDLPPPPPDDEDGGVPPAPDEDGYIPPAPDMEDEFVPPPPDMDDEDAPPPPPVVKQPVKQAPPTIPKQTPPTPQVKTGGGPAPPVAPPMAPVGPPPPPEASGITFTKKNHTPNVAPSGGRNNLLDAIRNQDNTKMLKKVTVEVKPIEPVKEANSIASILENKFAKTMDSDDDSDHDDDW